MNRIARCSIRQETAVVLPIAALQSKINVVIDEKIMQLLDQISPICHKHFSHEEIAKLIAFYETPSGAKKSLL